MYVDRCIYIHVCALARARTRTRAHTHAYGMYIGIRIRVCREHDFLSPFSVCSTTGSTRTDPRFKPMNAYSRYECFKSRQDYSPTSRYASGLENGSSPRVYKDGLFYYFSYRQERKRGKKRRIRRENNGREGWNGAGVRGE